MDKQYLHLRRRLFLGTLACVFAAASITIALFAVGGLLLQSPFARAVVWFCQAALGYSREQALACYQQHFVAQRGSWMFFTALLCFVVTLYLLVRRVTRWLAMIGSAAQRVGEGEKEPITLPPPLRPTQEAFHTIQRALAQREQETHQAEQRRQDLIAFLAHDLKTPLTSVLGYLELLQREPDLPPEQRAKYTAIALEKAQRLEELVSEFFDISRMEFQPMQHTDEVIHLSVLLEQLADEFYPAFCEKQLVCKTEIAPGLVAKGDADKLARVFDNVLRNAVSYSCMGGQIDLEAQLLGKNRIEIAIRNEGLEIPERELTNIFQKFYRLDQSRSTRTGGAGLGLAIAREIVAIHGGTIRAESDSRRTSFIIRLPGLQEVPAQ